ncbi:GNAT family N-acetyltransferase [Deinococcus psychrotolerans]|uniref:GNAT family N-acetyltransferase n=1 Tax=Deinococcus psychrotolerans TaxID=2489213 RepID=A0A3G8Y7M4_9DEIO|nr:GNAT family N-acetyltransferase [Deinococcus psychrotolerans]AZI41379.1 GNAT family N-acetyltransferase [Deinococcus psychrotolerans]
MASRSVVLFRPQLEPAPLGWSLTHHSSAVQMICPDDSRLIRPDIQTATLTSADVPDILALVKLTKPGPFRSRTTELGEYFGVREAGQLVALSGERLRLDGFTEVSAVSTHPDWRGRGLAGALVSQVARKAFSEGQTPFLHVMESNARAIRLYQSLGFVERARIHLSVWAALN